MYKTSAAVKTPRQSERMELMAQQVFLLRHGETEWSRTGRHTGRTDLPLTADGRLRAQAIGRALQGHKLSVWTSPLDRARETCRLAGFADSAKVDHDLREWDYGIYEGRTTLEIRQEMTDWSVWLSPIVNKNRSNRWPTAPGE
jgi:broad specificity phosphatase PhoE